MALAGRSSEPSFHPMLVLTRRYSLAMMEMVRKEAEGGGMMWRVIVRISYFHDAQSRLRNHVAGLFAALGLQNTNTGT